MQDLEIPRGLFIPYTLNPELQGPGVTVSAENLLVGLRVQENLNPLHFVCDAPV